eukprot:3819121-Rhodomonas_salina.1
MIISGHVITTQPASAWDSEAAAASSLTPAPSPSASPVPVVSHAFSHLKHKGSTALALCQ